jgi:hypothetical protein
MNNRGQGFIDNYDYIYLKLYYAVNSLDEDIKLYISHYPGIIEEEQGKLENDLTLYYKDIVNDIEKEVAEDIEVLYNNINNTVNYVDSENNLETLSSQITKSIIKEEYKDLLKIEVTGVKKLLDDNEKVMTRLSKALGYDNDYLFNIFSNYYNALLIVRTLQGKSLSEISLEFLNYINNYLKVIIKNPALYRKGGSKSLGDMTVDDLYILYLELYWQVQEHAGLINKIWDDLYGHIDEYYIFYDYVNDFIYNYPSDVEIRIENWINPIWAYLTWLHDTEYVPFKKLTLDNIGEMWLKIGELDSRLKSVEAKLMTPVSYFQSLKEPYPDVWRNESELLFKIVAEGLETQYITIYDMILSMIGKV